MAAEHFVGQPLADAGFMMQRHAYEVGAGTIGLSIASSYSDLVVIRSSVAGSTSTVTSLNSSRRPALCICQAMGPDLPAPGLLKPSTSTALAATGCATAIRAVPLSESASISTRLHSWGSNRVLFTE